MSLKGSSANKSRQKSIAFLEAITTNSPTAILVYNGNTGDCELTNRAMEEMTGGSIAQLLQQNFRSIASWKEAGFDTLAEMTLADGVTRQKEAIQHTNFGKSYWIQCLFSRFFLEETPYLLMIGLDISDRMKTEAELKEREERFRSVMEISPDIISIIGADGSLDYNSPAARSIHGYTDEELAGRNTFELIHPDDRERVGAAVTALMNDPTRPVNVQYRYLNKDGSYIWMEATSSNQLANPHVKGLITISRNISERKALELALVDSEERYRRLFEVESDAVFLVSRTSGRFIDANRAASEMYGYSREELLGMIFTDISAEPDISRLFVETHQTHAPLRLHRRKDGSIFPVEISGSYFDVQGDSIHVAAIRDISEQVKSEQFRKESMDFLEQQVKERTDSLIAANDRLTLEIEERKRTETELIDYQRRLEALGHELSVAEERERGRIASELHDHVGQLLMLCKINVDSLADSSLPTDQHATVKKLEHLLVKSIHEIRSLTFQLRPPILVHSGLVEAVRWLAEELKEHYGLTVNIHDDGQPKTLPFEIRPYLFQSVRELLLNAAKHSGTDTARVTFSKTEETIVITVEDEGVGFDPSIIFDHRSKEGGFGLFNLQQRLLYLGGRFAIVSTPGTGSRATIFAPLEPLTTLTDR